MVYGTLSTFSIGSRKADLNLLGESLSVLSPQMDFSTGWENGPGAIRTASATWTECCAAVTPRALLGVVPQPAR